LLQPRSPAYFSYQLADPIGGKSPSPQGKEQGLVSALPRIQVRLQRLPGIRPDRDPSLLQSLPHYPDKSIGYIRDIQTGNFAKPRPRVHHEQEDGRIPLRKMASSRCLNQTAHLAKGKAWDPSFGKPGPPDVLQRALLYVPPTNSPPQQYLDSPVELVYRPWGQPTFPEIGQEDAQVMGLKVLQAFYPHPFQVFRQPGKVVGVRL